MKITSNAINLSARELKIIESYRNKIEVQAAVDKLLDIVDDEYGILESTRGFEIVPKQEIDRLFNAPETDEDF